MENKLIELAQITIINTNNFIHGIDHIVRVKELAVFIANGIGKELSEDEWTALNLAVYWHDIGRVDTQKYVGLYDHAENSAESLYVADSRYDMQDAKNIKLAMSAIRNHRSSKGNISDRLVIDRILWDADKLDIFNSKRVTRIVKDYKQYGNNGDYDLKGSIAFWNSFDENYADRFHFEISKQVFKEEYPKFREIINKIMEEGR